jgi:hypothetical protein
MPKDLNAGPEAVYSVVKHHFKLNTLHEFSLDCFTSVLLAFAT